MTKKRAAKITVGAALKDTVMVRTTDGQRWRVIGMHQAGMRSVNISRALDIPRSTVLDIIRRHRLNPDYVKVLPRNAKHNAWQARIRRLVASLRRRILAVIRGREGPTRY